MSREQNNITIITRDTFGGTIELAKVDGKYCVDNIEFDADIVMDDFRTIFDYIGSQVLVYDDQELSDVIYEDYDFHYEDLVDFKLDILLDSKLITEKIAQKAKEMRTLTGKMIGENTERSASVIRNSSEWQHIIALADEIRFFLKK